jgi:hypothetical protein
VTAEGAIAGVRESCTSAVMRALADDGGERFVDAGMQGFAGTMGALCPRIMQQINDIDLARVCGGESLGDVLHAARSTQNLPLDQTRQGTIDFIAQHPFFHQGLMDAPIGGGKHFRNVPFIGPSRIISGALHGDGVAIQKGIEVTRGTWAAK